MCFLEETDHKLGLERGPGRWISREERKGVALKAAELTVVSSPLTVETWRPQGMGESRRPEGTCPGAEGADGAEASGLGTCPDGVSTGYSLSREIHE